MKMTIESVKVGNTVKSCPFCGQNPEIETRGSCIDFNCCVSMSIQKSDYLTIEERRTADDLCNYSDEIELKLFKIIVDRWNTRA